MCVKGNNVGSTKIVDDIQACKIECEKVARCKSIDYEPGSKKCFRNDANRSSSDYTECDYETEYSEWYYL